MDLGRKVLLLRENRLLRVLPPEEIDRVAGTSPELIVPAGQFIFLTGEPARNIYVLKEGVVVLSRLSQDGKEKEVSRIYAGDLFGELLLAPGLQTRKCQAQAVDDCLICLLTLTDAVAMMMRFPTLAVEMLKRMAEKVIESQDEVQRLSFQSTETRVAEALLSLAQSCSGEEQEVSIRVTHESLARMVGASRETVTGILGKLRRQGAINFNYGTVSFNPSFLRARFAAPA